MLVTKQFRFPIEFHCMDRFFWGGLSLKIFRHLVLMICVNNEKPFKVALCMKRKNN